MAGWFSGMLTIGPNQESGRAKELTVSGSPLVLLGLAGLAQDGFRRWRRQLYRKTEKENNNEC